MKKLLFALFLFLPGALLAQQPTVIGGKAATACAAQMYTNGTTVGVKINLAGVLCIGKYDANNNLQVITPGVTYNSTQPTLINGDVSDIQIDNRGNLKTTGGADATFPATIASGAVVAQAFAVGAIPPAAGTLAAGAITSAMTSTTSTSLISATASNYIYITNCVVSNGSTTVSTDIVLQDGSGGTTFYNLPAPAAAVATTGGGGGTYSFPTPLKVPTVATALYVANVTTGASTKVSCSGFKSTVSY